MSSEFKHIVRIAGRDLDGRKKIAAALVDLKGVGHSLAHSILNALRIDSRTRLGALSDEQIDEIEEGLRDIAKTGIPHYFFNRRKDIETGSNIHLIAADLEFMAKTDVEREKSVASWRGVRHSLGLKVRGQRTRTTGRKGRTIGVRKAAIPRAPASTERK